MLLLGIAQRHAGRNLRLPLGLFTTREIPLDTPGDILAEEWLAPMGITQYALAKAIDVPARRINEIVQGKRAIIADTAVRLGAFFGVDPQSWMNLQTHYDTEQAREKLGDRLMQIRRNGAANESIASLR